MLITGIVVSGGCSPLVHVIILQKTKMGGWGMKCVEVFLMLRRVIDILVEAQGDNGACGRYFVIQFLDEICDKFELPY